MQHNAVHRISRAFSEPSFRIGLENAGDMEQAVTVQRFNELSNPEDIKKRAAQVMKSIKNSNWLQRRSWYGNSRETDSLRPVFHIDAK
ncbi:hypothetical protein HG66A1_26160 [Gimesia chilikensis]|uniref:Uncharacterized protein n=1 Tax=Gimesia chilikensis TaxID=2605989 RepID=A0A517PN61_9PLAN|nr:hypothetical protein HG66A1_26160 [Gimesia chilikensis]